MLSNVAGSLFSGVGGLDEGLRRAGWRHAFLCEIDAYRRDVLRARFPGVPVYEDVREVAQGRDGRGDHLAGDGARSDAQLNGSQVSLEPAHVDLLCGGFPCQDVSVAGRRAGLAGERSGLFHEFARVVDALRPRWCLVENVPGLLSSNGGRDFGVVLGTLADLGYGVAWRVLDSRFFGVPQRRRRVFIVGTRADDDPRAAAERAGQVLAVGSRCPGHPATRGETRPKATRTPGASTGGDGEPQCYVEDFEEGTLTSSTGRIDLHPLLAAPLSHGSNPNSNMAGRRREDDYNLVAGPLGGGNDGAGRRTEDDPNLVAYALRRDPGGTGQGHNTNFVTMGTLREHVRPVASQAGVRRLMPVECERLQALPDGWTDLGGTPDSRRYAALGDAVTVSVAEWLGRRILAG